MFSRLDNILPYITYKQAINDAISEEMEINENIFVIGGETKMFGSLEGLNDKFGDNRIITTPISEEATTGMVLGAALAGMRPIQVHIRVDFMLLSVNQIVNMISNAVFSSAGKQKVPLVIRAVVGRGWGQGYQHSKSLHGMFSQIPGLDVIMPTTPYDVKGMLKAAIRSEGPVICFEHRWLYWQVGEVPNEDYIVDYSSPAQLQSGDDVTFIGSSWMNVEIKMAIETLTKKHGLSCSHFDIRSSRAIENLDIILDDIKKTKYCIIADNDWLNSGISGELSHRLYQNAFSYLNKPIQRIGFKQMPCPTARHLEDYFYSNALDIIRCAEEMLDLKYCDASEMDFFSHEKKFKGPF